MVAMSKMMRPEQEVLVEADEFWTAPELFGVGCEGMGWRINCYTEDQEKINSVRRNAHTIEVPKRTDIACVLLWGRNCVSGLPQDENSIGFIVHNDEGDVQARINSLCENMPMPQMVIDFTHKFVELPWGKVLNVRTGMLMD